VVECSHCPQVMQLVLDSLRHWVEEYHVDGFRFDLTSVLCRDVDGEPMAAPPVVRTIAKDPVLARTKQGVTLVHYSAQPEPFLTSEHPLNA